MRKLKSLLFTAGIATVLAIGVGAGVTTSNHDAIRADAVVTSPYAYTFSDMKSTDKNFYTNLPTNKIYSMLGIDWTVNATWGNTNAYFGWDNNKGFQIGSSSKWASEVTLSTAASNFGSEITGFSLSTATASRGSGKVSVTVGGTEIISGTFDKNVKNFKKSDTTGIPCVGDVVIKLTNTSAINSNNESKGMYIKMFSIDFKQGAIEVIPVDTINWVNTVDSIFENTEYTFTATVNETATYKNVRWSLANLSDPNVATIDADTGLFKALKPGTVDVVATARDENGYSVSKSVTINPDLEISFSISGNPVVQFVDKAPNVAGLSAKAKLQSGNYVNLDFGTDVKVEPAIIKADTTKLIFTYKDLPSVTKNITVSNEKTAIFGPSNYNVHDENLSKIEIDELVFEHSKGTSKNGVKTSYSEIRVYKGHKLSFTANPGYKITKIEILSDEKANATSFRSASSWTNAVPKASTTDNLLTIVTFTNSQGLVTFTNNGEQCRATTITAYYEMEPWMQKLTTWVNTYLKFSGADGFDSKVTDKQNACKEWFGPAKAAFLALLEEDNTLQEKFVNTAKFDKAQARYEAWALANGEKAYEAGTLSNISVFSNDSAIISIAVIAILSVSAIAMFAISKRKKSTR